MKHRPSEERIQELLSIWRDNVIDRDPEEYEEWEELIEYEKLLTYDEFKWCRENFEVEITAVVRLKESCGKRTIEQLF